jgi:hypothetical protein
MKEEQAMKCTECQMENIAGAIFCEECGAKLEAATELQDSAVAARGRLVLATPDGATLEIPEKDEVFPDIDLTVYGGMESGVSRKHAVMHRSGEGYTVEDMGSTNGTYVNRKRIQPNTPQAVMPGDEVRFGKLALSLKAA